MFIETGRYCRPILPRESRFCKFYKTNEVEDEIHLRAILMYSELRETFLDKLRNFDINKKKNLKDVPISFTPGNNNLTIYVVYYIHKCFTKRKKEMKMEE